MYQHNAPKKKKRAWMSQLKFYGKQCDFIFGQGCHGETEVSLALSFPDKMPPTFLGNHITICGNYMYHVLVYWNPLGNVFLNVTFSDIWRIKKKPVKSCDHSRIQGCNQQSISIQGEDKCCAGSIIITAGRDAVVEHNKALLCYALFGNELLKNWPISVAMSLCT